MITQHITVKLKAATTVLEGIAGLPDGHITELVRLGRVTPEQVYIDIRHFGYQWKKGQWELSIPRWIKDLKRQC